MEKGENRKEISRSRLLSERGTPPSETSEAPLRKTAAFPTHPRRGEVEEDNGHSQMEVDQGGFYGEEEGGMESMPPPAYSSAISSQVDPQEYPSGIPTGGNFQEESLEFRLQALEQGLAACATAAQHDVLPQHVLHTIQEMINQYEEHVRG